MHKFSAYFFTAVMSLGLAACGGGGGGSATAVNSSTAGTFEGNTAPAQIDAENAKAIGEASGESVRQAAASGQLPTGVVVSNELDSQLTETVLNTAQLAMLPSGIDVSAEVCPDGGTANVTETGNGRSGPYTLTVVYRSCNAGYAILSGTAVLRYDNIASSNTGFSVSYRNMRVTLLGGTFSGQTSTLNFTYSCTSLSNSATCSSSSDFTGSDGEVHRVSDFSISGSDVSGYDGTATFSHSVYGTVSITVIDLTYGSCGSRPDGGQVNFSSTNGTSGTITFNSNCTVSGTWNNGTAAGSF